MGTNTSTFAVTPMRPMANSLRNERRADLAHEQGCAGNVEASVFAAVEKLPHLSPGLCRLFRVEPSLVVEPPAWVMEGTISMGVMVARDRWFVADPSLLPFYAKDAADASPRLMYVDARPEDVEAWRVSRVSETIAGLTPASFSIDPENEYFVPRAVTNQRIFGSTLQSV